MKQPTNSQHGHRGAALIGAMLTLTLVAALSAGAVWHQWRSVEVERSERSRMQASWLLIGALDWARLILREDSRAGGADHLGEPWAVALQESRLSTFIATDSRSDALLADQSGEDIFLSGQMQDSQSRMNVFNLIEAGRVADAPLAALTKLFDLQGLDTAELKAMAENLRLALDVQASSPAASKAALLPQKVDQLIWLGLSNTTLERLRPHITWLPQRTPVNVNTASAEVLYASVDSLDMDEARRIVAKRSQQHFKSLADLTSVVPQSAYQFNNGQHSVTSRFFEVTGRLRLADGDRSWVVTERSLVQRDGMSVKAVWREQGGFATERNTPLQSSVSQR